ncbi:MAG: hypothetical protein UZ19_OD1000840 [Parcubacteria bacterium OLB19]|nr:MAG: hypothetical protein UZ19_OD1000840 [Parcubacteria bacterium OLB19]
MSFENRFESIHFPEIAQELNCMAVFDQDARKYERAYFEIDKKHSDRMKQIVAEIGWPTVSKVGEIGAHNAWLLIQHADHDVDFQEYCLQLMKEASVGEVSMIDVAYLTDRVCVNRGRGQLYGTQFKQEGGKHIPKTIEDEENVDVRRAEVGMGPLSEQVDDMYKAYPL